MSPEIAAVTARYLRAETQANSSDSACHMRVQERLRRIAEEVLCEKQSVIPDLLPLFSRVAGTNSC